MHKQEPIKFNRLDAEYKFACNKLGKVLTEQEYAIIQYKAWINKMTIMRYISEWTHYPGNYIYKLISKPEDRIAEINRNIEAMQSNIRELEAFKKEIQG